MISGPCSTEALVLALLFVTGCAGDEATAPAAGPNRTGAWAPVPSETILRVSASGLDNPRLAVVGDRATWESIWNDTWKGATKPPLPEIDFVLSGVLVVGTGRRAGPGYEVTIDSVVTYTNGASLYATELQPAASCQVQAGSSAPVHMVLMPGHPPVSDWRIGTSVRSCQ
jgi:hypothetical protein